MTWLVAGALVLLLLAVTEGEGKRVWIHPSCTRLSLDKTGPFVALPDGRLLIVENNQVLLSKDDGVTWTPGATLYEGAAPGIPDGGAAPGNRCPLIRTRDGVLILVYLDRSSRVWEWDEGQHDASPTTYSAVWAIRSLDEGRTWQDRQLLAEHCIVCTPTIIQHSSGRVVVPLQPYLRRPFRWAQQSAVSEDDGATWRLGNIVDLGGWGNHDGAMEAAVAERGDGRVLMLLRTNLGQFWCCVSEDGGRYWREMGPSGIDASAAPGFLLRLQSGRLALAWNRVGFEDGSVPRAWGGDTNWSEYPASSQRQELSLAFSDDDGQTWTRPVVVVRHLKEAACYPHLFERRPGELWLTTTWRPHPAICLRLLESDFV